jgi:hypothetical protein
MSGEFLRLGTELFNNVIQPVVQNCATLVDGALGTNVLSSMINQIGLPAFAGIIVLDCFFRS